ncbi:CZB domain-containing protein [Marinospirillum celere]
MVGEVIRRSEHMQRVIYETTTISFLNTVKLDHAVWKNEVYQRIYQQRFSELMVDHCNCRLGKWYFEGYGSRKYQHLQSFQDMDVPHKAVHTYGNQALEAGGYGDFEAMAAALEAMEDASQQVVQCLDQLEQDIVQG